MKKKATTFSNHNLSHQGFYSFPHPVKQNQQQKLAHQGIAAKNNALNSHKIPHKDNDAYRVLGISPPH